MDKRLRFLQTLVSQNKSLYINLIYAYKLYYSDNNLLEDCQKALKHLQDKLWKNNKHDDIADFIFYLDEFVKYLISYEQ